MTFRLGWCGLENSEGEVVEEEECLFPDFITFRSYQVHDI